MESVLFNHSSYGEELPSNPEYLAPYTQGEVLGVLMAFKDQIGKRAKTPRERLGGIETSRRKGRTQLESARIARSKASLASAYRPAANASRPSATSGGSLGRWASPADSPGAGSGVAVSIGTCVGRVG